MQSFNLYAAAEQFSQASGSGGRITRATPVTKAPAPAEAAGPRVEGWVKWYNSVRGFGFIGRKDGDDVFLHATELGRAGLPDPFEGQRLGFTIGQGRKGLEAFKLKALG